MKPWYEQLLGFLASLWDKRQLSDAGASPSAVDHALTVTATLPTFGAPNRQPPAMAQSRDLADCHPELVRRYLLVKQAFEQQTGRPLFETCTWRSQAEQQRLYAIGRRGIIGEKTVTQLDGVTKKGRHMVYPSEAVDVCVDAPHPDSKQHVPDWSRAHYEALGLLASQFGLVWGGTWHLDDYPHLELPAGAA